MKRYRRLFVPGGTYFFTVITNRRIGIFADDAAREILKAAWKKTAEERPFETVAFCLLPDHLHCVWTLPDGDAHYPARWTAIKCLFTRMYKENGGIRSRPTKGRVRRLAAQSGGYSGIWQKRYWEHVIRDETDFQKHVDYIHYNPVKHGLAKRPADWEWSTFRKYVSQGVYDNSWGESPLEWPEEFGDVCD